MGTRVDVEKKPAEMNEVNNSKTMRSINYESSPNKVKNARNSVVGVGGSEPVRGLDENDDYDNEDTKKVQSHHTKFNLDAVIPEMDLKALTNIFNSYATKKTVATGFFNLALVATNFAQMKALIAPTGGRVPVWNALNIVCMTFVGLSLLLQFLVAVLLIFLAKQGEFIDEDKRNQLIRSNNITTLLVLAISIINIFINVFISV
jgi:hypothetical protein